MYKASGLLENVKPLLDYSYIPSYIAEEYDFGHCWHILDQYDTTYKEVIKDLEESIKAAEEDIDSLQQQRTIKDGHISLGDVEKEAIGQNWLLMKLRS